MPSLADQAGRGRLDGKIAVVTGAGTLGGGVGTGKAIALLFAREGASVCVVDRDTAAAVDTVATIAVAGGTAFAVSADVTEPADCARCIDETVARFGGVDILVNNVGIANASRSLVELDVGEWQRVFDVNVRSTALMSAHVIPAMLHRGGGAIVNIASIAGLLAYGTTAYGPSKAAMIALTRETAVMHGSDGIRANAIAPGHLRTPMAAALPAQAVDARRRAGPLGIDGDAWDVAYAALYLSSDEARFVNGTCLPVDGGVTIVGSTVAAQLIGNA